VTLVEVALKLLAFCCRTSCTLCRPFSFDGEWRMANGDALEKLCKEFRRAHRQSWLEKTNVNAGRRTETGHKGTGNGKKENAFVASTAS